ncbi:MAG: 3-hydroxyacyl-CoA dehydrogenase family protein [Longimicrobiales bacterium]|nr:3-hydroxyacyl-CoA dehydrogenase family protein [Longimicrobiales bacterium]
MGVDGIGWIVFDDPQRELNTLTRPVMEEIARCLVEARAGHIDLALIMGAGFPPFRGGLLRYTDHLGLSVLVARLRDFAHRYGARFDPPPLLLELARAGRTFYTRFP